MFDNDSIATGCVDACACLQQVACQVEYLPRVRKLSRASIAGFDLAAGRASITAGDISIITRLFAFDKTPIATDDRTLARNLLFEHWALYSIVFCKAGDFSAASLNAGRFFDLTLAEWAPFRDEAIFLLFLHDLNHLFEHGIDRRDGHWLVLARLLAGGTEAVLLAETVPCVCGAPEVGLLHTFAALRFGHNLDARGLLLIGVARNIRPPRTK